MPKRVLTLLLALVLLPLLASPASAATSGYWTLSSNGQVTTHNSPFFGDVRALTTHTVAILPTLTSKGYDVVASDGGVFSFGDAQFQGSMGGKPLNAPIISGATASTGGYYLVAKDGGVFAFNAPFYGSMGGKPLNAPIVAMATTAHGYYLVAKDGGVFAFGDAQFQGSMGGKPLNAGVVSMLTSGSGYYLVASDGGVFAFNAPFYGTRHCSCSMVGILPAGQSYALVGSNGALFPSQDDSSTPATDATIAAALYLPSSNITLTTTPNTPVAMPSSLVITSPLHGSISAGSYYPDPDFVGHDVFTLLVNDSMVTVNVDVNPTAPTAAPDTYTANKNTRLLVAAPGVLANDSSSSNTPLFATLLHATTHGTIELFSDGSVLYDPAPNFTGVDTFTYTVTDSYLSSVTTATIDVS